jgi:glycine/serine hydroxymethyltransferase
MHTILELCEQYLVTRKSAIPLVASENSASLYVRTLLRTDLGNRYFIPKEDTENVSSDYPRQELISEVVQYTRGLALRLFRGSHASPSALSGNQCVAGILFGLTQWGDTVIGIGPREGGHWALSKLAARLGVEVRYIPFDYTTHEIDLVGLADLVAQVKPKFIMLDASHALFPIQLRRSLTLADLISLSSMTFPTRSVL